MSESSSRVFPRIQHYREQASEMLRRADAADTSDARCAHLMLAMDWKELADRAEQLLQSADTAERSESYWDAIICACPVPVAISKAHNGSTPSSPGRHPIFL